MAEKNWEKMCFTAQKELYNVNTILAHTTKSMRESSI
jgi:hypothetical protein